MDSQTIQTQALITLLVPFIIQLAKNSQSKALAWIDQYKPNICVLTSAVAALATQMEIEVVRAPHSLTISWPDSATLAHGLAGFVVMSAMQLGGQHVFYESLWRHVLPSVEPAASPQARFAAVAPEAVASRALPAGPQAPLATVAQETFAASSAASLAVGPQGGPL